MSALILLSNYNKMKKNKNTAPYRESDIPVDMKIMRAFRADMLSRISSTDAKIDRLESKVDSLVTEMKAMNASLTAKIDATNASLEATNAALNATNATLEATTAILSAKIDSGIAEMKSLFHQAFMMFEEQNLRNKQVYDSAAVSFEAVQDLKRRIKPECLDN